jgi:hypothetical protein
MPKILPHILVFLAPLALFLIPLLGDRVLFWGTPALQFIPWRAYGFGLLEEGIFPFWNPLNGLGAPLLANYQTAFLYPPSFILYIFYRFGDVPGLAWGSTLLVPLHLGWSGLGMMFLLGRLGVRVRGQVVAGLAFGMCAYLVARGMFFSMVWAGAWLPWLAWAADRVVTEPRLRLRLRNTLLLSIVFGMQLLAGHAQLTWYSIILATLWVVVRLVGKERFSVVVARLGLCFVGSLLAAGIALPQLLPTFEYLQLSQRSNAVDFEFAMTYSLWAWRLTGFLLPDLFGSPGNGNYWGYGAYWEDVVFIGVIPFLLAASTLGWIIKRRDMGLNTDIQRVLGFLWAIVFLAILLGLGKNTPVFPWLYQHIPTFDMFQAPTRYLIWAAFGLTCLAGIAADRWERPSGKLRNAFKRVVVVSMAIMLGAGAAGFLMPQIQTSFIHAFLRLAVILFCACVLALRTPFNNENPGATRLWTVSALGIILLDLWLAGANANPTVKADFYKSAVSDTTIPQTRVFISPSDEYRLKFNRYLSMEDFYSFIDWQEVRRVPLPNLNMLDNVAMVNNFDPLVTGWFAQWMEMLETLPMTTQQTILARMAVDRIIRVEDENGSDWRVEQIQPKNRITWKTCELRVDSPEDARQAMVLQAGRQNQVAECIIVETSTSCVSEVQSAKASIKPVEDRSDLMVIDVKAEYPGWIRISDSWYPGWKAELNGQPVPISRADALVKGVCIPSGEHRLTLTYQPTNFIPAAWLSLSSLLMCAAGVLILRKGQV